MGCSLFFLHNYEMFDILAGLFVDKCSGFTTIQVCWYKLF